MVPDKPDSRMLFKSGLQPMHVYGQDKEENNSTYFPHPQDLLDEHSDAFHAHTFPWLKSMVSKLTPGEPMPLGGPAPPGVQAAEHKEEKAPPVICGAVPAANLIIMSPRLLSGSDDEDQQLIQNYPWEGVIVDARVPDKRFAVQRVKKVTWLQCVPLLRSHGGATPSSACSFFIPQFLQYTNARFRVALVPTAAVHGNAATEEQKAGLDGMLHFLFRGYTPDRDELAYRLKSASTAYVGCCVGIESLVLTEHGVIPFTTTLLFCLCHQP